MLQKDARHFDYLDGYKGFAILLVVMSHMDILRLGSTSNAIFFGIAGFLTAAPFSDDRMGRYNSVKNILKFYYKKIIRIIPSYYLVLSLVMLCTREQFMSIEQNLNNFIFMDTYGHLWFIRQLMLMYLLTPFIYLLLSLLSKIRILDNDLFRAVFLFVFAIVFRLYLTPQVFYLIYDSRRTLFRLFQFLVGIGIAYLYLFIKKTGFIKILKKYSVVVTALEVMIIFIVFATSDAVTSLLNPELKGVHFGWTYPLICSFVMCTLLLLMTAVQDSPVAKLFSLKPFVFIGKISLQIYFIHWFIIPYINLGNKYINCIVVALLSIIAGYAVFYFNEFIARSVNKLIPGTKKA